MVGNFSCKNQEKSFEELISQFEFLSNLKSDTLEQILESENLNQLIKEAISRVFSGVSAVLGFEIMSE